MTLADLLQPMGSLCAAAPVHLPLAGEPAFVARTAGCGDVGVIWPGIARRGDGQSVVYGAGTGLTPEEALKPALAEALERYSMSVFHSEQFISATANELGGAALDLDLIPRCSADELANAKCPLRVPDKTMPIRWVRGISLLSGESVWIPAVLVYGYLGFVSPAERFWLVNSSGCAAHESYEQALLNAVYELVERDAVSVVWLQMLPLPRIEPKASSQPLAQYQELHDAASAGLELILFDATSDLDVPTIYAVETSQHDSRVATLVACAAANSLSEAAAKSIRDLAAARVTFRTPREFPRDPDLFTDVLHGAAFMAKRENRHSFDFLLHNNQPIRIQDSASLPTPHAAERLADILNRFRQRNANVFAVDLSTDEAIRVGMRVVRVIIPSLQPISFRHRARFLGHRRLYDAPHAMGYRVLEEHQINPWPQPFA